MLTVFGMVIGFAGIGYSAETTDSGSESSAKPNILFIFSDDHAYQSIGAYGSQINRTPN